MGGRGSGWRVRPGGSGGIAVEVGTWCTSITSMRVGALRKTLFACAHWQTCVPEGTGAASAGSWPASAAALAMLAWDRSASQQPVTIASLRKNTKRRDRSPELQRCRRSIRGMVTSYLLLLAVAMHEGVADHGMRATSWRALLLLSSSAIAQRRLGSGAGTFLAGAQGRNEEPRDTEVSTGEDLPEWARRDSNARPLAPEGRRSASRRRPALISKDLVA